MYLHIVMMAFHTPPPPSLMAQIESAFQEVPRQCDGILRFEVLPNQSLTSAQYSHALLSIFASAAHLETYKTSHAHEALMQQIQPHIREIVVLDSPLASGLAASLQ